MTLKPGSARKCGGGRCRDLVSPSAGAVCARYRDINPLDGRACDDRDGGPSRRR